MKWSYILALFTGIITNGYFYKLFEKNDYQAFLGLFLKNNQPISELIGIFISFIINTITGVNIYDLNSCLRMFGIL